MKLYWIAASIMSLFNKKARQFVQGRKGLLKSIENDTLPEKPVIWFHCASVGEFEQARPLIEQLKAQTDRYAVVLTFFSPSGYELRKNYSYADRVYYLPMDGPRNASRLIEAIRPVKAVFVKYEFWYYYLNELSRRSIDTYIVSAIFRPEQAFFKSYGRFFRNMLKKYTRLFVQDQASADLLKGIGIDAVTVAGDTRFDRVLSITSAPKDIPVVEEFAKGKLCLVAGSSWAPDEEIIVKAALKHRDRLKIVFAPHEIFPQNIERLESLLTGCGYRHVRFSKAEGLADKDVLIIDNIGMLSSIYRYADFAYIGGGFGVGIHNVLEPATYGIPVIYGPKHRKFREALQMAEKGAGFPIDSLDSLSKVMDRFCEEEDFRRDAGKRSSDYVRTNSGATGIIYKELNIR